MGNIAGGSTATSGSNQVIWAPLPTAGFTCPDGAYGYDTNMALTVTGKRFAFQYTWILNLNQPGSPVAGGIGWTGTARGTYVEIEYITNAAGTQRTHSGGNAQMFPTVGTNVISPPGAPSNGPFIQRGLVEYASTVTATLTPVIFGPGPVTVFNRTFRVEVLA